MNEPELTERWRKYNRFMSPMEAVEKVREIYRYMARLHQDPTDGIFPEYAHTLADGCIEAGVNPENMKELYDFVRNIFPGEANIEVPASRLAVSVARYLKKDRLVRSLFSHKMETDTGLGHQPEVE
jgi:hypothetical protein